MGPLLEGLRMLGYVDGKTMAIEYRFAEGRAERLPGLAAELVLLKPDVIFAYDGDVALHMKKATGSIPIVVMASNDPVQSGLVASLARPGANVTGIILVYDELAGKVLELLKEAVPGITRVAVLWNPDHVDPEFRETQRAATALGVRVQSLEVRRSGDFDGAFKAVAFAVLFGACQSMGDVKPGDGKKATFTGRSYEEIWGAAMKVANAHFEIRQQDPGRGIILGERAYHFMRVGAWVGIYVTPPASGVPTYTVEVVMRTKSTWDISEQGWESKVLRDLQDVLDGRPMK